MKAIVFHQHGGPEVLKYADVPDPVIRANEVLVRVRACALNHLDLWVRLGIHGVPIPLPHMFVSGSMAFQFRCRTFREVMWRAKSRRLARMSRPCVLGKRLYLRLAFRVANAPRASPGRTIAAATLPILAT